MKILIAWGTWYLWTLLIVQLLKCSHQIIILTRSKEKVVSQFPSSVKALLWKDLSQESLQWVDTVINLAWASLLHFPWTKRYKSSIYSSRIDTTRKLVEALPESCHTFVSGSAIWYYPSNYSQSYDITFINTNPSSFLENVCVDREQEAMRAKTDSRRVIMLRTWLVEWDEWFLLPMKTAIQRYWWIVPWSWDQLFSTISYQDRVDSVITILNTQSIQWPQNLVTKSQPLKEYMKNLAKELHRPLLFSVPTIIIKSILWSFGEMILDSHFIVPSQFVEKITKQQ
jgi:hypothetical protein